MSVNVCVFLSMMFTTPVINKDLKKGKNLILLKRAFKYFRVVNKINYSADNNILGL